MLKSLIAWWKRKQQKRHDAVMFERHVVVSFSDEGVTVRYPKGEIQSIDWGSVLRIVIETNDSGPWGADVWWLLEGQDKRVAYPQGATGDPEMLEQYPVKFPGFKDEQVIKAMGCTDNARFVCWEHA